jgi:hypothetical protein
MAKLVELKSQGVKRFGEVGAWAYDEWKMLNDTFFDGENKPGPIIWGSTPKGKSLGYYHVSENLIYLHKNLMRPVYPTTAFNWGIRHLNKRVASDVLLHEMIHQRVNQTGGWVGETSHNNERFVEEVNRIAGVLGMDIKARVIKQTTTRNKPTWNIEPGCLTLKELSDFPYSSRTYNYYYPQKS